MKAFEIEPGQIHPLQIVRFCKLPIVVAFPPERDLDLILYLHTRINVF